MNGINFVLDIILFCIKKIKNKEQIIQWYFDTGTYRYFQPIPHGFYVILSMCEGILSRRRNLKYFVLKITVNLKCEKYCSYDQC